MAPWILMFKKRNKIRYSLALILLFVILCSCNGKKSSVLIHNNNFKFWQMIDTSHKISKTIYYFDKNEKWLVFNQYSNSEFKAYNAGDIFLNSKWHLINDSIFNNGIDNKILSLSDTLFEFTNRTNGRTILKAYPDSLIPIAFRKIQ